MREMAKMRAGGGRNNPAGAVKNAVGRPCAENRGGYCTPIGALSDKELRQKTQKWFGTIC